MCPLNAPQDRSEQPASYQQENVYCANCRKTTDRVHVRLNTGACVCEQCIRICHYIVLRHYFLDFVPDDSDDTEQALQDDPVERSVGTPEPITTPDSSLSSSIPVPSQAPQKE